MQWGRLRAFTSACALGLLAACGGGGGGEASPSMAAPRFDTTMLVEYSPASEQELRAADPVALSYLARAWAIAGEQRKVEAILDELERRGRAAFGIGFAWANFPPITQVPNPADTVYVVTLVQVADAFRFFERHDALRGALAELDAVPMTSGGGCWSYSAYDVRAGCVHDVNLIAMAFLSRVGRDVGRELAHTRATMLEPGAWLFWEEAPEGYWAHRRVMDAGHLGWSAFMLMDTADPRLRELGLQAAAYVARTYDPATAPYFATYAVAAAKIAARIRGGCELAATLPQWARDNAASDPDRKNRQWAAYVHVWAQQHCR